MERVDDYMVRLHHLAPDITVVVGMAAIGLAITFGAMGVINMAHGELVMVGAYTTFAVQEVKECPSSVSDRPCFKGWSSRTPRRSSRCPI